jgi:hypothetical protein
MEDHLGESATAAEYGAIFASGKRWLERHLYNGEYYHQLVDLNDKSIPDSFGAAESYWDEEHGEIKYQIAEGCGIDQVLAQWHADLYGLGEVFDPKRTRRALRALFRNNFKSPIGESYNPCRIYCVNDESGLVICDWPEGKAKPMIPVPYGSETMNGFEYAAAIHMIQRGMVKQGMQVVAAVRERYDGERRNPWNEFECGSNYARSMASYALLNAFSGFTFDLVSGCVGFDPVQTDGGRFTCFWSLDSGWGLFKMTPSGVEVSVLHGSLEVRTLELPFIGCRRVARITAGGRPVSFENSQGSLGLRRPATVRPGRPLKVTLSRR